MSIGHLRICSVSSGFGGQLLLGQLVLRPRTVDSRCASSSWNSSSMLHVGLLVQPEQFSRAVAQDAHVEQPIGLAKEFDLVLVGECGA